MAGKEVGPEVKRAGGLAQVVWVVGVWLSQHKGCESWRAVPAPSEALGRAGSNGVELDLECKWPGA